ncbi:MAG TPA: tetratricopeptide repeat protein [Anaerolineales bacterium]|jgi:tetratricopeptide (TPR) repeat protein
MMKMAKKNGRVNLLFGSLVLVLGAVPLVYSLYFLDRGPQIQAAGALPPDHPELPQGHPPLDHAKELMALEQMSRSDPQNADYKNQIANIYYDMGQYQKAIDAYQQSLSLRPQDPSVETDMATSYHYLGQHDRALEILNKVLGYRPTFPQALFNKGVVLHRGKKDVRGAIAAWEELLRTNPSLPNRAELEQRISQLKATER